MNRIIIFTCIIIVLISGCADQLERQIEQDIKPEKYCEEDSDCVPASCCHSKETVNKDFAPDCQGIDCADECDGPLDCNCGQPTCINNQCNIRIISTETWCPKENVR